MIIRAYQADSDYQHVRACAVALQDYERLIDPRMPGGESIADEYMSNIFKQCKQYTGRLFVAEQQQEICGYVTVYTRYVSNEIEDGPREFGYIGDLFVKSKFRDQGIGNQLLQYAEEHARREDVKEIMIGVMAANQAALKLYQKQGFVAYAMMLEKKL